MATIRLEEDFAKLNTADSDDQLIIGLDFGTTFSGIAYVFTSVGKTDPISVTDWPGNAGKTAQKVPTVISYDRKDKNKFRWGYQLEQTSRDKLEGIKLLLDPDMPKPLYVPPSNTKAELERLDKPPIDVVSDYIGAIYKHALSKFEASWPRDYLEMLQKKFVLSVPAVWSEKAKDLTLRAAKNAGIHPITLIKEPEAAALYTLHFLKNKALSVGDAFVLCDAGGGTVDLISYEITKKTPLELKELVPGKGGLAGSLMLNKRFEQFVKDIVGDEDFLALRTSKGFRHAMKEFDERVKTSYMGDDEEYIVNFPLSNLKDNPQHKISANTITLKGDVLQQIFQPLIMEIQKLVDEQVNLVKIKRMTEDHPKAKEIKAIFLVGGFGSSSYLKDRLQKSHPDVQVIQPYDAWSAIVKGAVMSQLPQEAVIVSSIAEKHYGVSARSLYDEDEDSGQQTVWDEYDLAYRVMKMTWYIFQGEDLQRQKKIEFPFRRKLDADFSTDDLIFKDKLLESTNLKPPKYPKIGDTKVNCTMTSDLRDVPRSELRRKQNSNGKDYYVLSYNLAVAVVSGPIIFSLEVNGKDYGTTEVKYD